MATEEEERLQIGATVWYGPSLGCGRNSALLKTSTDVMGVTGNPKKKKALKTERLGTVQWTGVYEH